MITCLHLKIAKEDYVLHFELPFSAKSYHHFVNYQPISILLSDRSPDAAKRSRVPVAPADPVPHIPGDPRDGVEPQRDARLLLHDEGVTLINMYCDTCKLYTKFVWIGCIFHQRA